MLKFPSGMEVISKIGRALATSVLAIRAMQNKLRILYNLLIRYLPYESDASPTLGISYKMIVFVTYLTKCKRCQ
jgi:hypothetical protein